MIVTKYYRIYYPGLVGVQFKVKICDSEPDPEKRETHYAKGPNDTSWFPYAMDGWGNICNLDGIVVYPSLSGKHPLQAGERGYFGEFRENYAPEIHPELPSTEAMSVRAARISAGMTQRQLADAAGINIRQIQKIEAGELAVRNLTARNLLAIADILGVDPHEIV